MVPFLERASGQTLWKLNSGQQALSVSSVQFSRSVVPDSLRPHESQHARLPCPSPTPGVHPDSHPSSQWCHPAISSSVVPFSSCPQSLPASVFSNESTLRMRWPKYWSFSFSIIPSKEQHCNWPEFSLLMYFMWQDGSLKLFTWCWFIYIISISLTPLPKGNAIS